MDYKEKYKEALERAKGMYEEGMMPERIEYIFPELKESEDERIRKEILNVIHQIDDNTTICGRKYDYKKWIAWLGRQKPAWSKEDEIGLGNAMWAIEQARAIAKDENDMGNLWHAGWWLNSIKGRMKGE